MRTDLRQCITGHISIKPEVLGKIVNKFEPSTISAGTHFAEAGRRCRKMAFIDKGIMRIYNVADGKEITLWIGEEHSFITALSSFVFELPSRWSIQALTDAELLVIKREDHFSLLDLYPEWLEFDNRILANAFATLEERIFSHLYMSAEERYQQMMEKHPELFNKVPLRHIASMLGIAPETLSRLRSKQNT